MSTNTYLNVHETLSPFFPRGAQVKFSADDIDRLSEGFNPNDPDAYAEEFGAQKVLRILQKTLFDAISLKVEREREKRTQDGLKKAQAEGKIRIEANGDVTIL